ncbi:MAG: rod shape-determining protein MreD [Gammaproteobacteria bacterium]|jgi:rod shape-determining protein MreD|nr:rod shape-determining protein MreD [Gammaproteobacteria bacterium]MBT3725198.1 rod shape-determining protein MreD [Gammaproteobacteria bacterium]MBT4076335.1 rod shape-determining protein MreD [Gammaproteobacteria bacterium]MBT4194198.1 rod shape-determining protein MreD [Gammaproteobacteria bacterium]MBT4450494.1 rod shape-determining protein MreD [Gammaproteobacteria bacterium]
MITLNFFVIPLSLILGLTLQILPLPDWTQIYRPDWVALILVYWSMALPKKVGVWFAFFTGLIVDVMQGTLLGQHSLALVIIIFINMNLYQRIRVMSLPGQAMYVMILLLINQIAVVWIEGMLQRSTPVMAFFGPPLTGMFIWPWIFILLRDVRRKANLS